MEMQKMKKEQLQETANEFTNVKNIKGKYLYTRDGYVYGYILIHHYNLDLLGEADKDEKTTLLARSFPKKDFVYQCFPREIDLDSYKNYLKQCYQSELDSIGRRNLLSEMIMEAVELSTSGENFEHQHFIKIWQEAGKSVENAESEISERLNSIKECYEEAGIRTEILEYEQIIKLCNLFGNSDQISYIHVDNTAAYVPIAQIRK